MSAPRSGILLTRHFPACRCCVPARAVWSSAVTQQAHTVLPSFRRWLLVAALACVALPIAHAGDAGSLAFRIDEGHNINSFLREGPVAAHLLLRSGNDPRILVAFPAGNSGVGLWFEKTESPVEWSLTKAPRPVTALDGERRVLRGIEFEIETRATELRPRGAVLSSIRVLRDFELQATAPREVMIAPQAEGSGITWQRDRLDGAAGYRLAIEVLGDGQVGAGRFAAAPGKPLRLRLQALTGEPPLTPLGSLLTSAAGQDQRARDALAFLSYREKYLAGSWRFDTYFGRDTLISALLLAPVLEPQAVESAVISVLDRLAPNGEVAHEEDIGEFAVLRNSREGRGRIATPIYDYGMVDDDFLLAPLAARWLLDDERGRARAREFVRSHGGALARNLSWLVERTSGFAAKPHFGNLVAIKPGRMTGNWRDSEQGLGRGRYAYDINAALVPAALDAAARLADSGLLDGNLGEAQRRKLKQARQLARAWSSRAPSLFTVDVPAAQARAAITAYAKELGVDDAGALRALGDSTLQFHALSLDKQGLPVPVLHSDEGFRLLLTDPSPAEIERCIGAILKPFPAGLMTDAGMLVANPALADSDLRNEFTRYDYHGTVVWSWQQALMAAGLERQWRRKDLPAPLRERLQLARSELWAVIQRSSALRTSELWSWSWSGGKFEVQPFGRPGTDVDESNAAQLWSTVYLGLRPPGDSPAAIP